MDASVARSIRNVRLIVMAITAAMAIWFTIQVCRFVAGFFSAVKAVNF